MFDDFPQAVGKFSSLGVLILKKAVWPPPELMAEKWMRTVASWKRIRITGILVIAVLFVYAVSTIAGGAFKDFCEAAFLWVLIGIGVAASMTYFSQIETGGNRKN